MRIPALPAEVRLVPAEYQEVDDKGAPTGTPKPDAPVGVFRPVTGMEQAMYIDMIRLRGPATTYAQVAHDHLIRWDNVMVGDVPFDGESEEHRKVIDGAWWIDCGRELYARLHLLEKDAGKSSSPSNSD